MGQHNDDQPNNTKVSDFSLDEGDFSQKEPAGDANSAEANSTENTTVDSQSIALELKAAQEQIEHLSGQLLRVQAELQNVQKRAEKDIVKAHKFALEKFIEALLPVVDSLEQALEQVGADDAAAIRQGVELTHKMLLDVVGKFGVQQINPLNEAFDPNLHEAMSIQESGDVEANTVLAVFQRGYQLNDRLLRPARVVVSKAPAGSHQAQNSSEEKA